MENDNQQLPPQDNFDQDKVPLAVPAEVPPSPLRCDGDNNNNNSSKSNNINNISNIGNNNNNSNNICNSNSNNSSNIDNNLSNYISNINNNSNNIASYNNRNHISNNSITNIGNNNNSRNSNSNQIGNINNSNNIGNNSSINSNSNSNRIDNSNNIGNHSNSINNSISISNYNSNNINSNQIGDINNSNNIGNNRSTNSNSIGNNNSNNIENNSISIINDSSNNRSNSNNTNIIRNYNNNIARHNNDNYNSNYNRLYTVELGAATAMLVYISPESSADEEQQQQQQQQQQGNVWTSISWCISTLLIHNGLHYQSVIRNFRPRPELMHNFQQRLLNITRPVELHRQPLLPLNVFHMVEFYCQQLITASHNLEEVFQQHALLPAMVLTLRHTTNTLQTMLRQIEQSLFSSRRPQRLREALRAVRAGNVSGLQGDDDSDSDSNTESEVSGCEICLHRQASSSMNGTLMHHHHLHCDIDSTSSSESESDRRANLAYLARDFDENPQQFWSMTSSEDDNDNEEELGDEESWESWQSDFDDDDDSFDAYMVRLLRGHAHGHWSARQGNSDWVAPSQQTDGLEWDVGSCDSNDEYEEICSMLTESSEEDLDAWQYTEDRSFETELSRPFRRLIGEIPAQTAQQERHSWHHFVQLCEFRSDVERTCSELELNSVSYTDYMTSRTDHRSERMRRERTPPPPPETQHVETPESRHIWDHVYAINPNAHMNCLRQTIRAMVVANQERLQGTNSESDSEIDSEYNPRDDHDNENDHENNHENDHENENDNENEETETEFEVNEQEHEYERRTMYSDMDMDIELDVTLDMDAQLEQIVPLATFLQQTDELIAKLKARLRE